ncbi:MAG: HesA/MoeB/ThiF family protein [Eubacteriales bacterium]|jgi:molybdopterin/thiamine biosynthesis adenylyltransferase|nr:HesA/MoeB/ThiF family protein [Eubacteriales bacterium]
MSISNERYKKNLGAFTEEELRHIWQQAVCIVGCGGLGGHVIMSLARLGVGKLTLVDGDVFTASNLNRQIFCTENTLMQHKATVTKAALFEINSEVTVHACDVMLTAENACEILAGHDAVVDCLDNIPSRLTLEDACEAIGIPFVHGGIDGFFGQITSVFPGDRTLHTLFHDKRETSSSSSPAFAPQLAAALEVAEVMKILTGRGDILRQKVFFFDLLNHTYDVASLISSKV